MHRGLIVGCVLGVLLVQGVLRAADTPPEFPDERDHWLNSPPISPEDLKGKGALLYFFEETCPSCKARWPSMLKFAKSLEGKPIAFIAVNSGTSRTVIQRYAADNDIKIPVIVDADRSFEKACGVQTISLKNIWQLRVVTSDGQLVPANLSKLGEAAEQAGKGAAWNIDPEGFPESLRDAWREVEFGNFALAAKTMGQKRGDPDAKAGIDRLTAYVHEQRDKQLETAGAASAAGNKWEAYKTLRSVQERFNGYEIPPSVAKDLKGLGDDKTIKAELAAEKKFEAARRAFNEQTPSGATRSMRLLKQIVADFPETEAAAEAGPILDRWNSAAESKPAAKGAGAGAGAKAR